MSKTLHVNEMSKNIVKDLAKENNIGVGEAADKIIFDGHFANQPENEIIQKSVMVEKRAKIKDLENENLLLKTAKACANKEYEIEKKNRKDDVIFCSILGFAVGMVVCIGLYNLPVVFQTINGFIGG